MTKNKTAKNGWDTQAMKVFNFWQVMVAGDRMEDESKERPMEVQLKEFCIEEKKKKGKGNDETQEINECRSTEQEDKLHQSLANVVAEAKTVGEMAALGAQLANEDEEMKALMQERGMLAAV